jgi:hypothetical protein
MSTTPENEPEPTPADAEASTAAIVYPPAPAESVPEPTSRGSHTRTIVEIVVGAAAVVAIFVAGVAGFAVGYAVKSHDDRRDVAGGFAMGRMWEERGDSPFGGQFGQDPRGQSDQGGQQQGQPFGQGGRDGQGWGGMMPGQQQGQPGQQQDQDGAAPGAVPATPVPAG